MTVGITVVIWVEMVWTEKPGHWAAPELAAGDTPV